MNACCSAHGAGTCRYCKDLHFDIARICLEAAQTDTVCIFAIVHPRRNLGQYQRDEDVKAVSITLDMIYVLADSPLTTIATKLVSDRFVRAKLWEVVCLLLFACFVMCFACECMLLCAQIALRTNLLAERFLFAHKSRFLFAHKVFCLRTNHIAHKSCFWQSVFCFSVSDDSVPLWVFFTLAGAEERARAREREQVHAGVVHG